MTDKQVKKIEARLLVMDTGERWSTVGNTLFFRTKPAPAWFVAFLGASDLAQALAEAPTDLAALLADRAELEAKVEELKAEVAILRDCPTCDGGGLIEQVVWNPPYSGDSLVPGGLVECPDCEGTGMSEHAALREQVERLKELEYAEPEGDCVDPCSSCEFVLSAHDDLAAQEIAKLREQVAERDKWIGEAKWKIGEFIKHRDDYSHYRRLDAVLALAEEE